MIMVFTQCCSRKIRWSKLARPENLESQYFRSANRSTASFRKPPKAIDSITPSSDQKKNIPLNYESSNERLKLPLILY